MVWSVLSHDEDALAEADCRMVGITRDANGRPFLEDWETFSSLMDRSPGGTYLHKYPQLVSFVGQTS
jgi:hypothetical protein